MDRGGSDFERKENELEIKRNCERREGKREEGVGREN